MLLDGLLMMVTWIASNLNGQTFGRSLQLQLVNRMRLVVKMKITLGLISLVICYIILSTNAQFSNKALQQRPQQSPGQARNIFNRSLRNRRFSNLLLIPGIICYYAKNGRWPEYNPNLRQMVLQFSATIFSMNDEAIKYYCRQVFQFNQFSRPRTREVSAVSTPRGAAVTAAFSPFVSVFTTTTLRPFITLQPSTTLRPSTTIQPLTTVRTTQSPNGVTSTTTTTASPSATGTGSGTGKKLKTSFVN